MTRCRLCTANDLDELREQIAATMWSGRVGGVVWSEAGPYWRAKMLELADDALRALTAEQPIDLHERGHEPGTFRAPKGGR